MGAKTKIDWCDSTWNPVTGCVHGCAYCYARKIAKRFAPNFEQMPDNFKLLTAVSNGIPIYTLKKPYKVNGKVSPYPYGFAPTFHYYKLNEPTKWRKPRTIFVCSMADLFGEWIPDSWIKEVFDACDAAPWHRYIYLTKNPARLCRMATVHRKRKYGEECKGLELPERKNWWFGSTLDNADARRFQGNFTWNTFTSIEPLTERMNAGLGSFGTDKWTIIGAETGRRKDKVVPEREWVENIVDAANITRMKVFMKESLRDLMGEDFKQELPWEV